MSAKVLVHLRLLSRHFLVLADVVLTLAGGSPSTCRTSQATAQPRNPPGRRRSNALVHRTHTVHPRPRPLTGLAPPPHATPLPPPQAPRLRTATKHLFAATPSTNAHAEAAIFPNRWPLQGVGHLRRSGPRDLGPALWAVVEWADLLLKQCI